MFNFFKKKKKADSPADTPVEETSAIQEDAPVSEKIPTQTTINRDAPKKTYGKAEPAEKAPAKKEPVRKEPAKKEPAKKTAEKKAPAKKPAKVSAPSVVVPGTMPKELKGFEKELKIYAQHSRMPYDKDSAGMVFTEYMAKVFRELGYKMVLIRDQENGIITMLDREGDSDDSIKSKLVVKCVFLKKGSAGSDSVKSAYEAGESNRADETWCVTTTDFDANAVRRSKKKEAPVTLYDGQALYSEFLSKDER